MREIDEFESLSNIQIKFKKYLNKYAWYLHEWNDSPNCVCFISNNTLWPSVVITQTGTIYIPNKGICKNMLEFLEAVRTSKINNI